MFKLTAMMLGLAAALSIGATAHAAAPAKPVTVILVHGAWADGSSWNKVIPLLQAKGLEVVAIQNPLPSLEDDVAATKRAIVNAKNPVVLVGHSWAGTVITEAGNDPKVAALVYVAAFANDVGQTGNDLIGAHPKPPALSTVVADSNGFVFQSTEGVLKNFAPDIPVAEAKALAVTQGPLAAKTFGQTVTAAAWKTKPSWFVVSANDRVISPELEAAEAKQMNAKTTVLQSSHVSLLSHPKEVAKVIEDAVATVAKK